MRDGRVRWPPVTISYSCSLFKGTLIHWLKAVAAGVLPGATGRRVPGLGLASVFPAGVPGFGFQMGACF